MDHEFLCLLLNIFVEYIKIANGPCFGQPTDKCAQNCTGLPVPKLCAKYFLQPKTFDNQCSLDLFNCANADTGKRKQSTAYSSNF